MASAALGSLVVNLGLDAAEYVSGLTKAEWQAKKFRDGIARDFVQAAAAIGATASSVATATALMVKHFIDTADRLNDLRTVTGLSGQELLTLEGAAVRSGVGLESVGDVASKLAKRLTGAAEGTGDAANAFAAMGIQVKDANGNLKNVGQILEEVGAKFKTYEDGANKGALAVAALGKGGDRLIPMVEAIEETRKRFERLGITIDESTITAADDFKDSIEDLKSVLFVISGRIAEAFLPFLKKASELMIELANNTTVYNTAAEIMRTFFETIVVLGSETFFALKAIGNELGGLLAQADAIFNVNEKGWRKFDFAAAREIGRMMREDAEKARKEHDDWIKKFMTRPDPLWANVKSGTSNTIKRGPAPGIPDLKARQEAADAFQKLLDQEAKNELDTWKDIAKSRTQVLDVMHASQLIGETDYWTAREAIQRDALDKELAALDKQIVRQRAQEDDALYNKGLHSKEYWVAVSATAESQEKRNKLEREFAAMRTDDYFKRAQAANDYALAIMALNAEVLTLSGNEEAAARLRNSMANRNLRNQAVSRGDEVALELIDRQEQATDIQARLNTLREQESAINARAAISEEQLANSQRTGALDAFSAMVLLGREREKQIAQLEKVVQLRRDEYEELTRVTGKENPKVKLEVEQAEAALETLKSRADVVGDYFRSHFVESFSSAFVDFVNGTKTMGDAFTAFTTSVLNNIAKIAAQNVANAVYNTFLADAFKWIASAVVPSPRAGGGMVYPGQSYTVGERGPETFIPKSAGYIVPNGGMGGGAVQNYTFNFAGGQPTDPRQFLAVVLPTMKAVARSEIVYQQRPGGVLS